MKTPAELDEAYEAMVQHAMETYPIDDMTAGMLATLCWVTGREFPMPPYCVDEEKAERSRKGIQEVSANIINECIQLLRDQAYYNETRRS